MSTAMARIGLIMLAFGISSPLAARDATSALFELLDKGDCLPSSLTGKIWNISPGSVATHGVLNWGDQLEFEQSGRASDYDNRSAFRVWRNGVEWRSADGWGGACERNANLSVYVVSGKVTLDGCLHEIAFGRLDHDDALGSRLEVVFEHAEDRGECSDGHGTDAVRHPGHAHGDED